jgi:transposase-like protein
VARLPVGEPEGLMPNLLSTGKYTGYVKQASQVASRLERSLPKAAAVLVDAQDDPTAYAVFTRHQWRKIWFTNPLERVNKDTKGRTKIVGVFPNDDAVPRMVGAILAERPVNQSLGSPELGATSAGRHRAGGTGP